MKFVIEGEPLSKLRHRHFIRNGRSQTYDPQKKEKEYVKYLLLRQLRGYLNNSSDEVAKKAANLAQEQAYTVIMWFYMPIRESVTNSKRSVLSWNLEKHTKKPDLDNLEKFYLDCGNGILFPDDRFVTDVVKRKRYSVNPRTEITVTPREKIQMTIEARALTESFTIQDLWELETIARNLDVPDLEEFESFSEQAIQDCLIENSSILAEIMQKFGPQLDKFSKLIKKKEKLCQMKSKDQS